MLHDLLIFGLVVYFFIGFLLLILKELDVCTYGHVKPNLSWFVKYVLPFVFFFFWIFFIAHCLMEKDDKH